MKKSKFVYCSFFLSFFIIAFVNKHVKAQDVFEDIIYEPTLIKYEGQNNSTIHSIAERAFIAIKQYHNKTAQEGFDSILTLDKNNVLANYGIAYCKFADGDYENSIEILTPIININNKNGALYSLRGRNYMVLEMLEKAIEDFKKAVESGTNDSDELSLSECFFYSGDFNSAIAEADKYILKQPKKSEGYFVKGLAKAGLKDYEGAILELDKACDLSPKNSMLFYQTTRVFLEMKDFNKAVKSINKSIKLDAENSSAVQLRAEIKYELHDYTNSIFDCNRVVELGDASANTYFTRGKSNLKIGLKKEGCADFKKAFDMGNKEVEGLLIKNCN